jgi:hypothetical protein
MGCGTFGGCLALAELIGYNLTQVTTSTP